MKVTRFALLALLLALAAARPAEANYGRSAYSYVREVNGDVVVVSPSNGEVQAKRNLPISAGDEMKTEEPARAEVALADGNVLHVGGGTRIRFVSLSEQQGSEGDVSALDLSDGSVILSVVGADDRAIPRIDTADASVYANSGARVRVNSDVRRGTGVVVRAGSVEVKTRSGSYTVRAGNYLLVQGDQEPEIARGSFSRDRFDLWASDRLETTYDSPQSASSQYVAEDYAADVQSLDGYGDWDYNTTYSSYVWRPQVSIGWTPYSYGSWYSTPIGLSWWSSDPWGWYPYHYGNWFFDTGWNSWCWSPGYVYSPAWVYWGYTSNYLGWCPVGYYGFHSPWWDTYYKNIGWSRDNVLAINGRFSTRQVDMRGWNFTGVQNLGTRGRLDVVSGTRVVERLGNDIAVSSRPIVLSQRGNTGDALRDHVREAPRVIERTTNPADSERLAPVLGRQRDLPDATIQALRERTVVAQRGRLVGPGASELTARAGGGTVNNRGTVTDRARVPLQNETRRPESVQRSSPGSTFDRGRTADRVERPAVPSTRSDRSDAWRGQSQARSFETRPQANDRQVQRPDRQTDRERPQAGSEWRARPSPGAPGGRVSPERAEPSERGSRDGWRSRPDVPPAQRVIEGSVPGRRPAQRDSSDDVSRHRGYDRQAPAQPGQPRNDGRQYAPRNDSDRGRSYSPPSAPSAPRDSAPRSYDRAPAPRSAPQAAPPRSAPAPAPRSAPPPSSGSRGRP